MKDAKLVPVFLQRPKKLAGRIRRDSQAIFGAGQTIADGGPGLRKPNPMHHAQAGRWDVRLRNIGT